MCVCGMEYCIYEQWNLVFSRQLRVRNEMFSSKKKKEKKKKEYKTTFAPVHAWIITASVV